VFFAVAGGDSALPDVALAALGSAVRATRAPRPTDGGWELQVEAPHEAIPALLEDLVRRGIRLTELRTHSPTLEDVFVTLTGRALRDG